MELLKCYLHAKDIKQRLKLIRKVANKDIISKRMEVVNNYCNDYNITGEYDCCPHGSALRIEIMYRLREVRLFLRCGYGPYNYAPCFIIREEE